MRSIKTHFGFIMPLVFLLFSLQFVIFIDRALVDYRAIMQDNYAIVLVANKELFNKDEALKLKEIKELNIIDPSKILAKIEGKMTQESLNRLKKSLPNFYDVKLSIFPNKEQLKSIVSSLEKLDGIKRVESFSKSHDSIYNVFLLAKQIVYVFSALVAILGVILILKQISIWLYEHKERISILDLFGATFMLKSTILYKMAMIDSIIATAIVTFIYYEVPNNLYFSRFMQEVGLQTAPINLKEDPILLFNASLAISIISVTFVMLNASKKRAS
ncbi:FtsX-like permease family protein [uncultured Campylobacter sp.]|uniref:FtsX-like permease family protein n=1 Tax=uncultured Campylobacter sp. TaxID=218934 RepID=UPI00260700C1|nr:FtsX-like permease family protein [uncultured Campylobacter sp.]